MNHRDSSSGRWKDGAQAPVLLFVDDLSNRWVEVSEDGGMEPEGDYGYMGFDPGGGLDFLQREILSVNDRVKTTFFAVSGRMSPPNTGVAHRVHSYPMNHDGRSREFFRRLSEDPRFEIAYHGLDHGRPGPGTSDFVQEWQAFSTPEEAEETIARGVELFQGASDALPRGGKYCGYLSNDLADVSIDRSGFIWWCRYYNRAAVDGKPDSRFSGTDTSPVSAFDIKTFGRRGVIDIPTTLPGNLLNRAFARRRGLRGLAKRLVPGPLLVWWRMRKLSFLLRRGLVISIQEHICPERGDGVRQRPNIRDDVESLRAILGYLRCRNVWYCTCSELADWVRGRDECG